MKSRKSFWFAILAVTAVGLMIGVVVADRVIHTPVQSAQASWAEIYKSPKDLARSVDVVALAQAVEVAPSHVALSDRGEGPLPFQLIDFDVIHSLKGTAPGNRLTVERAGGVTPQGRKVEISADGGEFVPGQVYLLFLKRQPKGSYYYQVNDQGRYQLKGDQFLAVAPDDPVATSFHGATLEQGIARVEAALGGARPSVPIVK